MGKVIAFVNQKGGVGKTTSSINLAASLGLLGKKTLLVDLDPQGNSTTGIGVDKSEIKKSVYDLLTDNATLNDVVIKTKFKNLYAIPATINLAGADIELVEVVNREKVLRKALSKIKDDYDYICIDCPPSLALITVNSLTASDSVIIPIQCEYFALEGLSVLMYTLKLVKKHLNPDIDVEGVVLTMKDGRSNLGTSVADDVSKYFNDKVYKTVIPRNIRLAEAPSYGEPINIYDPKSTGGIAYKELTEEFLKRNK
jgi:chromosome partitioning protein